MAYERTRVFTGTDSNGHPRYIQISGKTQNQRNDNIVRAYITSGRIWEFMDPKFAPSPQTQQREEHPFSVYAHDWYNRFKEPSLGASTKVTQKGWLRSLCKHFGNKVLEGFTVDDIQDYLNSMQHLKKPTIDQRKTFLGEILDAACEDGIIKKNPAKSRRLTNPGKESDGISSMLRDDYRRLLEKLSTMEDARIQLMLSLMAYTGLRREEVLGLMWEDIDFETGFLHVQRAVIIPNAEPIIKSPKTKKSNRHVPMSDALIEILRVHHQPAGFVITDHEGKLFTKSRYKKFWSDLKEYVGIPDLDARQLRHTYATMTHAAGVEIRTVGACMGHTKTATTDRYTQVEPTRLSDVRNAMTDYVLG